MQGEMASRESEEGLRGGIPWAISGLRSASLTFDNKIDSRASQRSNCSRRRTSSTPRRKMVHRGPSSTLHERRIGRWLHSLRRPPITAWSEWSSFVVMRPECESRAGVMSCRVFGLDVELAVLAEVVKRSGGHGLIGIVRKLSSQPDPVGTVPETRIRRNERRGLVHRCQVKPNRSLQWFGRMGGTANKFRLMDGCILPAERATILG